MKTKKRKNRLGLLLIGYFAYALLTGGLAISNSRDFGGQRGVDLADGIQSDLWLEPESINWSIPFVGHYYGASKPFGLRIQIWDTSKSLHKIEIERITVTYDDGEVVSHTRKWVRTFEEYTQTNSSSSGIIRTEMLRLSDTVDGLVERHQSATLTIRGQLHKSDGTSLPFSVSEDFEAKKDFRVTTFWSAINEV